ncbi:NADH-quinone oxidoreductase subunit NuoG [Thalassotalea sp. HSM 43]|uniref:NADH-quinone oxidoreductase subunit NuoG n=1 Tax=Thalassotalea sp. HSM 43 TaxID=2552945 RepID=UPI0016768AB6|nr:NADH-quinone oxidoreductase subunit NuoG [Thalassotalea sp. HSM 43]
MTENNQQNEVTFYVDGKPYQGQAGDNLLSAMLSNKLNVPYFCWHPELGSIGACRQCAVTQYNDDSCQNGRLIMACMTPITQGMHIGLSDDYSADFRQQIISAMMTNHPHDCPVCAEGGECHLQDMTVMTGHSQRQFQGAKRTFSNQDLGPLIGHEMNRCITCYRCDRYYSDYAHGKDFAVYGSKNQVYFGRQQDGVLESEFAGNLVEVCPTGVFTDKPFSQHYSRKWDLQSSPSVCQGCSVGCNISVGERYGITRRIVNRYNHDINGYFLCDKGRFGFQYVNSATRIRQPQGFDIQPSLQHSNGNNGQASNSLSEKHIIGRLSRYKKQRFVAMGSASASIETNLALKHLFGSAQFCSGLTDAQTEQLAYFDGFNRRFGSDSVRDIEQCDWLLVVGEDLTQTSPRLALAVRQMANNVSKAKAAQLNVPQWQQQAVKTLATDMQAPIFQLTLGKNKLSDICAVNGYQSPADIVVSLAQLTAALTHPIEDSSVADDGSQQDFIQVALAALKNAQKPMLICGQSLAGSDHLSACEQLLHAMTRQGKAVKVCSVPNDVNSLGLYQYLDSDCLSIEQMLALSQAKSFDGMVVAEQSGQSFSKAQLQTMRDTFATIICLDYWHNPISESADVLLPVATFDESQGLVVNFQGKAQCFYPALTAKLPILPAWRYIKLIDEAMGNGHLSQPEHDANDNASLSLSRRLQPSEKQHLAHSLPTFWHRLKQLQSDFIDTDAYVRTGQWLLASRQTPRASGRTAMYANQSVHEPKSTIDLSSPFNFSMEGFISRENQAQQLSGEQQAAPPANAYSWAPGWNSNQSVSKYQTAPGQALNKPNAVVHIYDPTSGQSHPKHNQTHKHKVAKQTPPASQKSHGELNYLGSEAHIFADDAKGRLGFDFELLSPLPAAVISADIAQSLALENSSHLRLNWQDSALAKVMPAQTLQLFVCDEQANGCLLLLNSSWRQADITFANNHADIGAQLQLTAASAQQVDDYEQSLAAHLNNTQQQKAQLIADLKQQDQYIPIRLVAGGLDDS